MMRNPKVNTMMHHIGSKEETTDLAIAMNTGALTAVIKGEDVADHTVIINIINLISKLAVVRKCCNIKHFIL